MSTMYQTLVSIPLIQSLPAQMRPLVVEQFVQVFFTAGQRLICEGTEQALYVLISGQAQLVKQGSHGQELVLRVLQAGDWVGDPIFFEETPEAANVRAVSDVEALKLGRSALMRLIRHIPDIRAHVALESRRRRLLRFFRLYTPFPQLPTEALDPLFQALEPVLVPDDEVVIRQGDNVGPLYLIESGHLRVFIEYGGEQRKLTYLKTGDFFGEMAILKQTERAATVATVSPCRLLALSASSFLDLLEQYPEVKTQFNVHMSQYRLPQA